MVEITIEDVPQELLEKLANRAALRDQELEPYLRDYLLRLAQGPDTGPRDSEVGTSSMGTSEYQIDRDARGITDVTSLAIEFCEGRGDGLLSLFAPHSTVGLALMQAMDGSDEDLKTTIDRLFPREINYAHVEKAPGHGADHVIPVSISPSLTIPVQDGKPLLGTWQQVVLVDLDEEPTSRRLRLSFLSA